MLIVGFRYKRILEERGDRWVVVGKSKIGVRDLLAK